jgi:hypothetical protein
MQRKTKAGFSEAFFALGEAIAMYWDCATKSPQLMPVGRRNLGPAGRMTKIFENRKKGFFS